VVLPGGTQQWIASRGRGYPGANETPARMLARMFHKRVRKTLWVTP
jgi:hypothetical protein